MALFGSKKNTEAKAPAKATKVPAKKAAHAVSYAHVLSRPRITEKAAQLAESMNVYTFEIAKTASKHDVMKAVTDVYKVDARKVTIVSLPGKTKMIRGKIGTTAGVKKALVYLKKGDKIEFV